MKKVRRGEFDPSFSNASLEEMAELVKKRDQITDRRNKGLLLIFFLLLALTVVISLFFYAHWLTETIGALWQMVAAFWHLKWWQAGAILLEYKLSFFILGMIIGVIVALFIVFQVIETLIDWVWDGLSSLFN
ncbi:MAG: hypothetical protein DYG89_08990 [Caldilinea sp. CFX5]|nr:hypothetical protein [Caldilinea sp. CFX5]